MTIMKMHLLASNHRLLVLGLLPTFFLCGPLMAEFDLDKDTYAVGEAIRASWSDSLGNARDWVGIYSNPGAGPVNGEFVGGSTIWLYTNGTQTAGAEGFVDGSVTFGNPGLPPGDFIAFFLEDDGYLSIEDPVEFSIAEAGAVAPEWHGDAIQLVRAEIGQEYRGRLAPYAKGSGNLRFSKADDGAAWLTVEEDGELTGTPAAGDLGSQSFQVKVESAEGLSAQAGITVIVTPPGGAPVEKLSVMTYNLWVGGQVPKNLEAIIRSGADVVGLQESNGVRAREHAAALGWHAAQGGGSTGILSKYPIVETQSVGAGIGARIQISADPPQEIVFWSCHLTAFPYGPYDGCWDAEPVDVLLARETSSGRLPQVRRILDAMSDAIEDSENAPVFLVGDFNSPSHLDWTEAARDLHCGYAISWPVTGAVDAAGLADAYREAHPDPVAMRGDTWSPIHSLRDDVGPDEEPQDRIDMIHFAGKGVSVESADVFLLPGPLEDSPNHGGNAWPSDHAAVVSTLTIPVPQEPRKGAAFSPSPASEGSGILPEAVVLEWRGDFDAVSFKVYFGTSPDLGEGDLQSTVEEPRFSLPALDESKTYYWRIDTLKPGDKTVAGEIWTFSTSSALGDSVRWEFEEGSGTTVADSGGGGINGVFFDLGEEAWVDTEVLDKGVELTVDDGFIEFGEEPGLRPEDAVTMAAWVKPAFFGDYAGVAGYVFDTGAVESGYSLHTRSNDRFGWGVGSVDRGSILYLASAESYEPDQWYFVVGTYDGSESRLYVNGSLVSSGAMSGPIDWEPLPEAGFVVGSYLDNNDDIRFEGQITQVEFWQRALSGEEIRAMFTQTGAAVCPSDFQCTENSETGEVVLSWSAPANVDATSVELLRDGIPIATLALDVTTFADAPPNAAGNGLVEIVYTLKLVGEDAGSCPAITCTANFFNGSVEDDLVLYLPFDDDATDRSGSGLETELLGMPANVEGAIGGALEFDDTADPRQYVLLEDSELLQFGEDVDFTVSFWVQTESSLTDNRANGGTNYDPAIISNKDWNSGLNPGWVISGNSSNAGGGQGHLEWNIGDGSARADFDTTDALINDGEWHHVLVSHDRDDVSGVLPGRSPPGRSRYFGNRGHRFGLYDEHCDRRS